MGSIRIRPNQAAALKNIAEISSEQFAKLAAMVAEQSKPSIRATEFLRLITDSLGDEKLAKTFCKQTLSLATFRRVHRISSEDLVDNLLEGMEVGDFPAEVKDWYAAARGDLIRLFECDGVRLPAKALNLSTDHAQVFTSANIITDVRPVFDGARDDLVGAVVVPTLRVHYITSGGVQGEQELSLALDIDDIEKLIDELKKALKKSDTAKREFGEKLKSEIFVVGEETYGFG